MEPQQAVIAASGFVGAFFWAFLSFGALFEPSPKRISYALTGLCLTASCLAYGGVFSSL